MRDETEWVETVESGWNTLVGADETEIIKALSKVEKPQKYTNLYGDGRSGEVILDIINRELN